MKPSEKSRFGIYFLAVTIVFYLIVGFIKFNVIGIALENFLQIFVKILPILVIIYLLMVLTDYYLNKEKITNISKNLGSFKSWVIFIFGGILSSGPIYMWYPFLADLKNKGIRTEYLVAFLYNRAIKIPLIPMMLMVFNPYFIAILFIVMIFSSIIQGKIVEVLIKNENSNSNRR